MAGLTEYDTLPERDQLFPEPELPDSAEIIETGRKLSRDWGVGPSEFLKATGCGCEAEYKSQQAQKGRIMQHAHMGFRDKKKSERAFVEIYESALAAGVTVDRFGICLDWSMGIPKDLRKDQLRGTGVVLESCEDFARVSNAAPVASHYGDFMLGFPAALENTQYALSAGATVIGNLGQYFTFRLPGWSDDLETTRSTITAIALMAAQPVDVLVHSNLDDGFAGVLSDLACALGAAMLEKYLVEDLIGGRVTHCYGHHYSDPLLRFAFQKALKSVSPGPGSMVYGNTVLYKGTDAQNYASLAAYLQVDIQAQRMNPSGHAINPVPVSENRRIPDVNEILDAQLFAHRLVETTCDLSPVVDLARADELAATLIDGATQFRDNVLSGFTNAGIDTNDAFEMFLAIRRIGGRTLERLYGPGSVQETGTGRRPLIESDLIRSINREIDAQVDDLRERGLTIPDSCDLRLLVATTDVHEHGKMLIDGVFDRLGVTTIDGGTSAEPDALARIAEKNHADAIALSTYNGVALTYYGRLKDELLEAGTAIPILIGGQLNEIPEDSDNSLPRDVTEELADQGAVVCKKLHDAIPCLVELARRKY